MGDHPEGADSSGLLGEVPLSGLLVYARSGGPGRATLTLHGDADGTVGHPLADLRRDPFLLQRRVHADDRDAVREAQEGLASGDVETVEYRVLGRDGEVRWVRDTFRFDGRRPDRVVGVLRAVTEERTLREQVGALERRIWRSQRMDSLGSLAAGVAHDFNNLLTTILSSVQLLDEAELTSEARSDLALIRQAADRGARMVRQILRFARRGDAFTPGAIDVGGTVETLRPILERTLGVGCDLRIRVAPDLPTVRCDTAQLEQVLLNLVVNARDAMPTGGVVRVTVTAASLEDEAPVEGGTLPGGDYVVVRVHDDGRGIPEEVKAQMFEPFFTTKSGEAESGSGFGLSTVRRIVTGYGGGITVDSAVGEGTTFGIWLPVDGGVAGAVAFPEVVEPVRREVDGARVLVAEGDPEAREAIGRLLARDGHAVVSVGSAVEAIRAFERAGPPPQLAFVSAVLPDRYGRELVTALRRRVPHLPVILASGRSRVVRERGEGSPGGDDAAPAGRTVHLARPFTPAQLRAAVERALAEDDGNGAGRKPSVGR